MQELSLKSGGGRNFGRGCTVHADAGFLKGGSRKGSERKA